MLTLNGKKMSKSVNNSVLPNEVFNGNNKFLKKFFSNDTEIFHVPSTLQKYFRFKR